MAAKKKSKGLKKAKSIQHTKTLKEMVKYSLD
jgi:hypothetical protein